MLIEESEDVVLPLSDRRVHEIVSVLRGFANRRVDLQLMRLGEPCQFASQGLAGCGGVVVRRVKEHDGNSCLAHCSQHALAYRGRALPGTSSRGESDRGSQGTVALRREKRQLTTERVPHDRDAMGVDSR